MSNLYDKFHHIYFNVLIEALTCFVEAIFCQCSFARFYNGNYRQRAKFHRILITLAKKSISNFRFDLSRVMQDKFVDGSRDGKSEKDISRGNTGLAATFKWNVSKFLAEARR